MKRYEKMSKEDIIKLFVAVSDGACSECMVRSICIPQSCCSDNAVTYLQQDIEVKPRIAVIDSIDWLEKAEDEFKTTCRNFNMNCCDCKYFSNSGKVGCFKNFLAEEIEVVE